VKDHAGNMFRHRVGGAEHHFAVVAATVGGRFDADLVEALLDGARRFIGGQDTAARCHHGLGYLVELCKVHLESPSCNGLVRVVRGAARPFCPASVLAVRNMKRERARHFTPNTSTPGKALPSSHSRNAPPAVET